MTLAAIFAIGRPTALATNGTYLFLTDDSGVGNAHLAPTTDDYDVELLNEAIIRLVNQYVQVPACNNATILAEKQIIKEDTKQTINYYPNPTSGEMTIELKESVGEMYITDISGKILQRWEKVEAGKIQADLSNYASGIYFLKWPNAKAGKILLTR